MKIFDKAQWHIDAGENERSVTAKFKSVFDFLDKKGLLSEDGKEILEIGIDSSISLNERMVTKAGYAFLDVNYDEVINCVAEAIAQELEKRYIVFDFKE